MNMLYQHLKLPELVKIGAQYTGSKTFCMEETGKRLKNNENLILSKSTKRTF